MMIKADEKNEVRNTIEQLAYHYELQEMPYYFTPEKGNMVTSSKMFDHHKLISK